MISPRPRLRRVHGRSASGATGWRPGATAWLIAVFLLAGSGILLYPSTAQWLTSYNQSLILENVNDLVDAVDPSASEQLEQAHAYNAALTAGVQLEANSNVPVGDGSVASGAFDYSRILSMNPQGLMARIKIPAIQADLPIYHGTSDATLLEGVGHLEGSSFPVGGIGTHSVLTAHRGLADATMFSNLDQVVVGDTFTIEVFGEVLTYRVRETKVVAPEDTDSLRAQPGEDLVTLVTCTPLGINTHRILVTGERITPTPIEDVRSAGEAPEIPGFPWWFFGILGAVAAAIAFVWRAGFTDAAARAQRASRSSKGQARAQ